MMIPEEDGEAALVAPFNHQHDYIAPAVNNLIM